MKNLFILLFSFCIAAQAFGVAVVNDGPETDADLLTISIQQQNLFYNPENNNYWTSLESNYSSSDSIAVTTRHPDAVVTGAGSISLRANGYNDFTIHVVGPSGTEKDYVVSIYVFFQEEEIQPDVIQSVSITAADQPVAYEPAFNKDIHEYTCPTPVMTNTISILATPLPFCQIEEGEESTHELVEGVNRITITAVTATGRRYAYTFIITRIIDTRAPIRDLSIFPQTGAQIAYTPAFDIDIHEYSCTTTASIILIGGDIIPNRPTTGFGYCFLAFGEQEIVVTGTAQDGISYSYTITVTRVSPIQTLSIVTEDNEPVAYEPAFDPDIHEYSATTSAATIAISGIIAPDCSIRGEGVYKIWRGENPITVTAVAEDGSEQEYLFLIMNTLDHAAPILNMSITTASGRTVDYEPAFSTYITKYRCTTSAAAITVSGEIAPGCSIRDVFHELTEGEQEITFTGVTADGTLYPYTITVTRIPPIAVSITANDRPVTYEPAFSAGIYQYTCQTTWATAVTVSATPADGCRVITGNGNHPLSIGTQWILVTAEAADGTQHEYGFLITRSAAITDVSITAGGQLVVYEPAFNAETYEYHCTTITTSSTVTIAAQAAPNSDAEGTGVHGIEVDGNRLVVTGIGGDGTRYEYIFFITRSDAMQDLILTINDRPGIFAPAFSPDIRKYYCTTSAESITISAIAAPGGEIRGDTGTIALNLEDDNIFSIISITEDGEEHPYTLFVTRTATPSITVPQNNRETDADLLTIAVQHGRLEYVEADSTFTVNITQPFSGRDSISVTTRDPAAFVTGAGPVSGLRFGSNSRRIHVKGPSGAEKSYNIVFVVSPHDPVIAELNLTINGQPGIYTPALTTDIYEYHCTTSANSITLSATAAPGCEIKDEQNGTYELTYDLVQGDKRIPFTGIAENGDEYEYAVIVSRHEMPALTIITVQNEESNDADLLTIAVQQGSLYYDDAADDPDGRPAYRTNLKNPFSTTDYILVGKKHPEAVVTGDGPVSGLAVGRNKFPIHVESPSGDTKDYLVTFDIAPRVIPLQDLSITIEDRPGFFTPAFSPDVYEYQCVTSASAITIAGTVLSGIQMNGLGIHTLRIGDNHIPISGWADNEWYNYTFLVTRTAMPSISVLNETETDADLLTISVQQGTLRYDDADTNPAGFPAYRTILYPPFSTTDYISVTTRHPEATVTGDGPVSGLANGWNDRRIHVVGPSRTEKDYTVTFVVYASTGIETPVNIDETVSVYNLSGLLIGTYRANALQGLPAGFYILKGKNSGVSKKTLIK